MKRFRDDGALVQAAAARNKRAMTLLAERLACVPRMVRVRRRQLGAALENAEEDLVQDVVLAVWSRLDRFRPGSSFEAWVWGFVLRLSYKRVERIQRRPKETPIMEDSAKADDTDLLWAAERSAGVQAAMEELDGVSAKIVRRRHFAEASFEDIGAELEMPPNTAKTRYYRALKTMAGRLRPFTSES